MTAHMVLVETVEAAPASRPDQVVVVMDTAWRPDSGTRSDLIPLGPAVGRVLAARDLFADARVMLDDWAAAVDLDAATSVNGFAWWYRYRLSTWLTLTRVLHWRAILDELAAECWPTEKLVLPEGDPSLLRVGALLSKREGLSVEHVPGPRAHPTSEESVTPRSAGRWFGRRKSGGSVENREAELRRRREQMLERVAELVNGGAGRLLVLVAPTVAQKADLPDGERLVDPFLEPVVSACLETRLDPVLLAVGSSVEDDSAWASLEADPRLLSEAETLASWAAPEDEESGRRDAERVTRALAALPDVQLVEGGLDLSGVVRSRLARFSRTSLARNLVTARRAGRLMSGLGFCGVALYNEYNRRDYVTAARAVGVPSFAVQHGIIYPGHVGYVQRRTSSVVVPTRTFVYGPYEADVMRRLGGYHEGEVEVTGSPRLSLVTGSTSDAALTVERREQIRSQLGVAPHDRMLVISTTHERMHRRFYWPNSLMKLLDGPLPGVHLVFKQHPSESDDGGYRELVDTVAHRAGVEPPPVTVVRDIDLFSLLRAADAHLGLFSTVLTDAVAAGTPNLVATTQARQDLLGYVDAGVAVPVSSNAELRSALELAREADPAAREAFLANHMAAGEAPSRIRDAILATTAAIADHARA